MKDEQLLVRSSTLKHDNESLFIYNLEINDSGNYTCNITNTHGEDHHVFKLRVIGIHLL